MFVVLYISSALRNWGERDGWHWFTLVQFTVYYAVVPVIGLYFSLRSRFVLLAWAGTIAAGYVLPHVLQWIAYYVLTQIFSYENGFNWMGTASSFVLVSAQITLAAFLLWRLHVNLVRRSFVLR
jgi:hypothetical protein